MSEYLFLFLILVSLQPVLRQKLLEAARARLIGKLERARGSRVILLVHRQETMGLLGFPILRYIDVHDSEQVLRACHMTDDDVPIDLVVHTPGGLVLAALQIARALRAHRAKVTVFVPHYAMSGGTLIALAADEIVIGEHAVLGPVDPQVGELPASSLLRVVEQKSIDEIDDETLVRADVGRKAIEQLRVSLVELLGEGLDLERREAVASELSDGRWTHDFPITPRQALELGLPISTEMPDAVFELMNLFPQPSRRQPGVEFLPGERHAPAARIDRPRHGASH